MSVMKGNITKQKILRTSIDHFCKYGFAKASIRDIVREVGISNAALYNHFKNKEEILFSIIEEIGSKLMEIHSNAKEIHKDPSDRLRSMIKGQISLVSERPKEVKIYVEEQYQLSSRLRRKAREGQRKVYDMFYLALSEIEAEGLLKGIDKTVCTFCMFGVMNWTYRWFKDQGRLSIEDVAEYVAQVLFQGFLKDRQEKS